MHSLEWVAQTHFTHYERFQFAAFAKWWRHELHTIHCSAATIRTMQWRLHSSAFIDRMMKRKKGCKNDIFLYWKFNPFKSATQKMALQFKIWLFLFTERWFECSLLSIDFFCIVLFQIHVQNESNDFWLSNNERAQRGWKQLSHFLIADEYIALVKANS